jgi:predicted kinase
MTKICYILVGMPASGKSTWIRDNESIGNLPGNEPYYVASTDNIIDFIVRQHGMTYDQGFKNLIAFAESVMWDDLQSAAEQGIKIYIDRTNLTVKSRKKFIDFLKPYGYTFEAIVFNTPDETEWRRRLDSRQGKTIPEYVLESMRNSYEVPTLSEGFECIKETK